MKKIIALALVLISIFALCACGEAASPAEPVVKEKIVEVEKEVPVVPEEYVKYQGLIDALEAEDYDKAYELIHDMVPVPEATEVEITNDNFFDYFELHMDYEPARYVQKDSSGNVTTFSLVPAYVLKDEYKIATDSEHQSKLEIGVKFKELMDTDWSNEMQYYIDSTDTWSNFDNFELTADSVIVLNFSDNSKYRFALCDGEEAEYTVFGVNLPAENAPEAVEIIGTFDGWQGTAMEKLENGWFFVELDAKASQFFKFRSAGAWPDAGGAEIEVYDAENEEQRTIKDNEFVFGQLWQDDTYKGTPCKLIELDMSNPDKYRWSGAQGIENIVLTEKAQKVVVDGVLYIVRDNKMFNVQGTQVR